MPAYDIFARFYDILTADVDYAARAHYFHNLIRDQVGERATLLDLACGTGSLSLELKKIGYDIIAVDRSPEMLSVAMQKAQAAGMDMLFLNQDMTRLDLYGDIDAAVCALDSLNHLPSLTAFERTLARVGLFLRPGGVFMFDLNTPYKHREQLADNCFVYDTDDVYCVWQNRTEGMTTHISLDFFVPVGTGYQRYTEQFTERAFTSDEVDGAIRKAGLELVAVYNDDSLMPPHATSSRIVYLTRKV